LKGPAFRIHTCIKTHTQNKKPTKRSVFVLSLHYKKDRVYFSLKNRLCTRKNNFLETYFDCSVSQDAYEYKKNYGGWHNTLSTGFIFLLRVDFGETSLLSYVQWFGLGSK